MLSKLLIVSLIASLDAGLPDGGVDCDTPYAPNIYVTTELDGSKSVCLDEHSAVCVAKTARAVVIEQAADEKALRETDPSPVTVAIWATGAAATAVAITLGILAGTGHLK